MQPYNALLRRTASQMLVRSKLNNSSLARSFHKDYDAGREEQTLKLADGRTIGFAEYGALEGVPAFFFHGSPGSRYDGSGFIDVAKKLNVRIISPDRPGHGLSSFQENRKISDYPTEISELAKHLGIAKYHVFGASGGGPYAVACAYGSPQDELLNAAVVAGMAPPAVLNLKDAGLYTMVIQGMLRWTPGLIRWLITRSLPKLYDDKQFEKQLKFGVKFVPKEERHELLTAESLEAIKASIRAAYVQGPNGVIRDSELSGIPWDFELKDVTRKVMLFYGSKDTRTPLAYGRYYKSNLPNAELTEYEGTSHWTMYKRDEEVLKSLIGSTETSAT